MNELIKTVENVYLKLKKISGMQIVTLSVLFVVGLSFRLWRINSFGLFIDEESVFAYIASDILRGKIVYKEMVDNKMPYFYFSIALMFFLFGKSIIYPRLLTAFLSTSTLAFIYLIGKELYDGKVGLIAAGIYVLDPLSIVWCRYVMTEPYMTFFATFAIFMYLLYRKKENSSYLFLSGFFSGVSFFMKQPGIVTFFVIIVCIFIDIFEKGVSNKKGILTKQIFISLLGVIIALLPGLTYLLLHNAFGDFIQWCFIQITVYKALISARLKIFYVVLNYNLLIWTLGLSGTLLTLKRRSQSDLIALSCFLIPFAILVSLPSFLDHYFLQVIPSLSIISAVFFSKLLFFAQQLQMKDFSHEKTISMALIIGIVSVPYVHSFPFIFYSYEGRLLYNPVGSLSEDKKVGLYLEERTSPDEKIFSFHPRFVFQANREILCKYIFIKDIYYLDAPNSAIILQEVFETLESSKVNYAVFANTLETLQQRYTSYTDLLKIINYLQENYMLEKNFLHAFIYRYNGVE